MARSDPRIHRLPDRRDGAPRWQARWWGADGKQAKKTFRSYGDAGVHLLAVDMAKAAGRYTNPSRGRQRLGDYFAAWIEQANLEPSTRALHRGTFSRFVAPTLGDYRLSAISREALKGWIGELLTADAPARSVAVAHGVLRRVLAEAVRDGILAANAAAGISVPPVEHREMRPLEASEVAALAAVVPDRDRALILLLSYASLRIGEALGLRVRHVDLMRGRVMVAGALKEVGGRLVGATKTKQTRTITLPRFLVDELTSHLEAYSDPRDPMARVFPAVAGGPMRVGNWRRRTFYPACERAGLAVAKLDARGRLVGWETAPPRIHNLRHTCAALLIAQGAGAKEIADRLGHSSPVVTTTVYAHILPSHDERLTSGLDETFRTTAAPAPAEVVGIGGGA